MPIHQQLRTKNEVQKIYNFSLFQNFDMRITYNINKNLLLAIIILVSVVSNYSFAQNTQRGSFISINGDISSGHLVSPDIEKGGRFFNAPEILGSLNLGWYNYWNHLSCEIQFTVSPFVTSLSNQRSSLKTIGMQFWFGYSIFDNEIFRISPAIGFGSYNFHVATGGGTTNAQVMLGIGGEAFIPESRIMLGLRGGYQHNFLMPTDVNSTVSSAAGAVVQLRTGIRLF